MRGNDNNIVKAVMSWKPTGKRPGGCPKKKWMDVVEENLKKVEVNHLIKIFHNWKKWLEVVKAVKILLE